MARKCQWHLHAHVGRYCVSGVGEYRNGDGPLETVGCDRLYEVMVFDVRRRKARWVELAMFPANSRDSAVVAFERALAWASKRQRGHLVRK